MLKILSAFRVLGYAMVASLLFGSLILFCLGVYSIYKSLHVLLWESFRVDQVAFYTTSKIELLHSVDNFLLSVVFVYFAFGSYYLLAGTKEDAITKNIPDWLKITSIGKLKVTLIEVVVVIMIVNFLEFAVSPAPVQWLDLVYPISILALAACIKLMRPER